MKFSREAIKFLLDANGQTSKRNSRKKTEQKAQKFWKRKWEGYLKNFRFRRKDAFILVWKHEHTLSSPVLRKKQVLRGQRAFHGRLANFYLFCYLICINPCRENKYFAKKIIILKKEVVYYVQLVLFLLLRLRKAVYSLQKLYRIWQVEFCGMDNPPNQTIYINNLNEKIKKDGEFGLRVIVSSLCMYREVYISVFSRI